jgi:hypothetical protein
MPVASSYTYACLTPEFFADLDRRKVIWKKFYNVNFPSRLAQNRGEDGLFTAAKWEPLDSGLIGPVTLTPVASLGVIKSATCA